MTPRAIALAAFAGALFALATPPFDLYPALWLGMAGLAFALEEPVDPSVSAKPTGVRRAFEGGARGLAFGAVVNVLALRFVPTVVARFTPLPWAAGALGLVLLAGAQGLGWAVAAVVRGELARRGVASWLAFAIGVYAGTFVPAVFPWSPAGGVTPWPAMVQLADAIGERGVSMLMALSAGLLAVGFRHAMERRVARAVAWSAVAVVVPLLTLAVGALRIRDVEAWRDRASTMKIGLVQPSTGAEARWEDESARPILDRLTRLTATAERGGAELTLWPESAYPLPVAHTTRYCPMGAWAVLPYGVHGPVLTGLLMTGGHGDRFNSAAICASDGTLSEPYDKLHLLWFGETVPLVDRVPWIRNAFARGTGMLPGTHNVLQIAGHARASVLNCFEDTLAGAGREAMADCPNLLVNLTNDAWFAGSAESELHLRLATLRAVEERRDLVRAVNFGPTSWIDAAGRVRARYAGDLPAAIVVNPALLEGPRTFFGRWGDLPTALVVLLVLATSLAATKRQGRRPSA